MATTERPDEAAPAASDVAASCREAGLVRLVGAPRGDALAGVGLLARALVDVGLPFQASVRNADSPTAATIAVEASDATHDLESVLEAYAVASELEAADPVLGLAGVLARGGVAPGQISEDATAAGLERRPGIAVPTADVADGLAHTTLVHGPFSGDRDAAAEFLDGLDVEDPSDDEGRRVASRVALAIAEEAPPASRAGTAVERLLRPSVGGPFETIGGYADVLDALAQRDPGLGLATALGSVDREAGLDVWRSHGRAVHAGVAEAALRRHDGLLCADVADLDGAAMEPIARLIRDFRSPEPAVLVRSGGRAALATGQGVDAVGILRECLEGSDGAVIGHADVASAIAVDGDVEAAVREAVGRAR